MILDSYISEIKKEKKLLKNTSFMLSTGAISAVASMISTLIFSRFLGPSGYGLFKIAMGLATTAAYILDIGVKFLIPRYIAEFEAKKQPENIAHLLEKTLLIKAIIAIFVLIFAWFFSQSISQIFFHSVDMEILVWPTIIVFIVVFLDIILPILMGYQNFKMIALTTFLVPFNHIIFGLPLVYFFGIRGLLFAASIAFIAGSIPAIRFIIKKAKKGTTLKSFSYKSAYINYSLPAYFSSIPTYINVVIIPFLSLFYTQKQVGYYSFSLSFFTAAQVIPLTLSSVMFPKVAQLNSINKSAQALKTYKRLLVIYTPVAIFLSLFFIPIVEPFIRLFAPAFLPSVNIIILQTISSFAMGYFVITVYYVTAVNKLRLATILNWILSLSFGALAYYLTGLIK
jgi:O-antigen/teichoic acid export membrane protein